MESLEKASLWGRLSKRKLIVGLVILLVVIAAVPVFLLLNTSPRVPLAAQEFTVRIEEAGYVAENRLHQLGAGNAETFLVVESDWFFIEFLVFSTEARARQVYSSTRRDLEDARSGGASSHTEVSLSNFSRFTQTFSGQYAVVSRIENTLVFAHTTFEHRSRMNDLLGTLGY